MVILQLLVRILICGYQLTCKWTREHELKVTCYAVMENMLEFWRCFVFWISAFLCLLIHARTSSYGKLCVGGSPLSMATFHPSSENYAHALCHSTANHRLVLDPVGIGFTILLRLSLTPSLQEFEARHSHSILESYSEYHRQGLDFPDSHECRHQF